MFNFLNRWTKRYEIRPGLTSRWEVWLVSAWTGSDVECIGRYQNRGHALARIRGIPAKR